MRNRRLIFVVALLALGPLVAVQEAQAYIGPGLGAGIIGVALGLIGSVFVALFAMFWYPMKRMFRRIRRKRGDQEEAAEVGVEA